MAPAEAIPQEELEAYSRTVADVAERLAPPVANLRVTRRTRAGQVPAGTGSASEAAARISDLVISMRNYSRLDEAPEQEVDLHQGLEDTLKVLGPKLKAGVTVERDYGETLPPVLG